MIDFVIFIKKVFFETTRLCLCIGRKKGGVEYYLVNDTKAIKNSLYSEAKITYRFDEKSWIKLKLVLSFRENTVASFVREEHRAVRDSSLSFSIRIVRFRAFADKFVTVARGPFTADVAYGKNQRPADE